MKRSKRVPPGYCPEPVFEVRLDFARYFHPNGGWRTIRVWEPRADGDGGTFTTRGCYGGCRQENVRMVWEHGDKIKSDQADLRLPWKLAPLAGKYYGTKILDADDEEVVSFWDHDYTHPSHPSPREKANFGNWTEEAWADYCCDSHWENERDYARALAIVNAMNGSSP